MMDTSTDSYSDEELTDDAFGFDLGNQELL
jgi:hypothetical protein